MKIKARPQDFLVQERVDMIPAGSAPGPDNAYGLYILTKTALTTPGAVGLAAGRLRVPRAAFRWAGLKDRVAVTTQAVTIASERDCSASWPDLELRLLGWVDRHIRPADIRANEFHVIVRDLSPPEGDALLKAATERGGTRFVNYFDDQRFGSVRAGPAFAGEALVRRRWPEALFLLVAAPGPRDPTGPARARRRIAAVWGDWPACRSLAPSPWKAAFLRMQEHPDGWRAAINTLPRDELAFHLAAWQSQIWNDCARAAVRAVNPNPGAMTGLAAPYLVPSPGVALGHDVLPTLGRRISWPGEDSEALVREVLGRMSLKPGDFVVRGLSRYQLHSALRPLMVRPEGLRALPARADDLNPGRVAVELGFGLPPGAYATMCLKSLLGASLQAPADEDTAS